MPPAFVTPMAAQVVTRLAEGDDWIYELEFDRYRALIIKEEQRVEASVEEEQGPHVSRNRGGGPACRRTRFPQASSSESRAPPAPLLKLGKFRHRPVPFLAGNPRCHWQSLRKVRYRHCLYSATVMP